MHVLDDAPAVGMGPSFFVLAGGTVDTWMRENVGIDTIEGAAAS